MASKVVRVPCAPETPVEIQKAGEELLASYKLLEDAWKKAESMLAKSHVPVDVRIEVGSKPLGPDGFQDGCLTSYLAYVRLKTEKRICLVEEEHYFNGPDEQVASECRPITECPVDSRLEMLDRFPKLYAEVLKTAKSYVPKIKEKVSSFENTLELIDL